MFKSRSNAIFRFNLIVIFIFTIWGLMIMGIAAKIMFIEREDWEAVKQEYNKKKRILDNIPIPARRGNILNDNGELMVSTLPQYRLYIDFMYINKDNQKDAETTRFKRDSLWQCEMDNVCQGLNEILPLKSVEEFKATLTNGWKNNRGGVRLYNGRISYTQYKRILQLPIFKLGKKYSGLRAEEHIERRNIFGEIGISTLGIVRNTEIDGQQVEELNGLEETFDSYLRGTPGVGHKIKVGREFLTTVDTLPIDGLDIQTTINSEMLDICNYAVETVMRENSLAAGWAILMETKTGDIKAVVNLTRNVRYDGKVIFYETTDNVPNNPTPNHAFCRLMEPGSIFKTVALTAILEDGKLSPNDSVIAYPEKVHYFDGRKVTDEMYRDNGTGKYCMGEAMMYSSNISMVQYIKKAYQNNPAEYTNTLTRFGLTENYNLISSEMTPYLTVPGTRRWSKTSLNSMSYGYAVGMTGINIVSFYNTIANKGRQMRPRLVKAVLREGEIVEEFPTTVLNEQLLSRSTTDAVTEMLVRVVNGRNKYGQLDGTGKRAWSPMMTVAGKTGTADIPNPRTGAYDGEQKLMSFCGFFPAEEPEYTLLVQVMYDKQQDIRPDEERKKLGGGSTAAVAFNIIAERIMAMKLTTPLEEAVDNNHPTTPEVLRGNIQESDFVLEALGFTSQDSDDNDEALWGRIGFDRESNMTREAISIENGKIPDVRGMGAKDALYLLQLCNLEVNIEGYGKVVSQDIEPGSEAKRGETITIKLEP